MTSRDTDAAPGSPEAEGTLADSQDPGIQDAESSAGADVGSPVGADASAKSAEDSEAASSDAQASPRRKRRRSFWRELPILVAVALVLAVVIKTYALQAFFIPSGSMENTLLINDRVLINKLVYDFRSVHRGDIVVFNGAGSWDPGQVPTSSNFVSEFFSSFAGMFGFGHPADIYVKRVIGLPGDHVACCDAQGRVTVNGTPLYEQSYLYPGNAPSLIRFDIVVPAGRLWVLGDHRELSADSRTHLGYPGGGTIPQSAVLGRAFIIIWPPSRWSIVSIPAAFQQPALDKQPAAFGSAKLEPEGPALPLTLGFVAAVPVTWAQRRIRVRIGRR
jgi:signal peptidase I